MPKRAREWRSETALLIIACCTVFASCATQNLPLPASQAIVPLVVKERPLPPAAEDPLLAEALGEYAGDRAVSALIDAIRRFAPAPLTAGNRVTPLVDGPETFAAARDAIRAARRFVHVETFIYGDDELGREFTDLLVQKRREGVEVRVLYDAVGSRETPRAFFDEMRSRGIEVREFRPMNPLETPQIWEIHNRDHRKIIVVDGIVGFTGGINVDDTYASSSSIEPGPKRGLEDAWRDTHVRIEGPAVRQLQTLFVQTWNEAGEHSEFGDAYFPTAPAAGKELVTIVPNDSDSEERWLYGTVLAAFEHASSRLWITQAYFAPNPDLLNAMTSAVTRGVDVRLIVPAFSDSNLVLQASRATYEQLLRGGVRIFERKDALLHAKTVVIDSAVTMIGSANLDMRSFLHNDEANATIVGRESAQRMEAIFERDQQAAREIDLQRWQRRSLWQRTKEFFTKLVGYWL